MRKEPTREEMLKQQKRDHEHKGDKLRREQQEHQRELEKSIPVLPTEVIVSIIV